MGMGGWGMGWVVMRIATGSSRDTGDDHAAEGSLGIGNGNMESRQTFIPRSLAGWAGGLAGLLGRRHD